MPIKWERAAPGGSPLMVAVAGGTNSGKSWSILRMARGFVGPKGKIAAVDTESGRLRNLSAHHDFEITVMSAPFKPSRFAEYAEDAENHGADAVVFDSFSMMHVGPGGYRDWHDQEVTRLCKGDETKRDAMAWPARRAPSLDRQAMLYRLLQVKIPIFMSCRAVEKTENKGGRIVPIGWRPIMHEMFYYDVTLGLTLRPEEGRGIISHKPPFKIERDFLDMFRVGDQLSEDHGAALAEWSRGDTARARAEAAAMDAADPAKAAADDLVASFTGCLAAHSVYSIIDAPRAAKMRARLKETRPELSALVEAAVVEAVERTRISGDTPQEGKADAA